MVQSPRPKLTGRNPETGRPYFETPKEAGLREKREKEQLANGPELFDEESGFTVEPPWNSFAGHTATAEEDAKNSAEETGRKLRPDYNPGRRR